MVRIRFRSCSVGRIRSSPPSSSSISTDVPGAYPCASSSRGIETTLLLPTRRTLTIFMARVYTRISREGDQPMLLPRPAWDHPPMTEQDQVDALYAAQATTDLERELIEALPARADPYRDVTSHAVPEQAANGVAGYVAVGIGAGGES